MDFIMDNYLWFGIVGVVLLMALIGFLAEKTNFIVSGGDRLKKKKKKKRGKVDKNESVFGDMSYTPEENVENMSIDSSNIEPVNDIENIPAEILDVSSSENKEPVIESAPIENTTWDNLDEEVTVEEPVSTVTETGEDLTVPLTDESETADNATISEDEDIWKF